jgi:acyl-coenzyme A thioesterase PaaI-like protein
VSAQGAAADTAQEAVFSAQGELFVPSEHARGPWDPEALHGGAPAALLTRAFQLQEPGAELPIARLNFELLRPVPSVPLSLTTRIVRPGRRVQELAGEIHAGEELICRASALRVQPVPEEIPPEARAALGEAMPPPEAAEAVRFALDDSAGPSFAASAMEMRALDDPLAAGPARVWMRLRRPLVAGEPVSALARAAATADFGNGVSAVLPFERFLFINADLSLHLHRQPRGEWIGLQARTLLHPGGSGLAESVLHDRDGAFGRAFQTLVVQAR